MDSTQKRENPTPKTLSRHASDFMARMEDPTKSYEHVIIIALTEDRTETQRLGRPDITAAKHDTYSTFPPTIIHQLLALLGAESGRVMKLAEERFGTDVVRKAVELRVIPAEKPEQDPDRPTIDWRDT